MKTARISVCVLVAILLAGMLGISMRRAHGSRIARRGALEARLRHSKEAFRAGNYVQAETLFQSGYSLANQYGERNFAARFLANAANCRFARHRYSEALGIFLQARDLAAQAGDQSVVADLDTNIASVYEQLGDFDAAAEYAERNRARTPEACLQLATLRVQQGRTSEALALFRDGIREADRSGDLGLYAIGWNRLGEALMASGRLNEAEFAMLEAFRIRKLNHLRGLDTSYRNLGTLRLAQGDSRSASVLLDEAVHCPRGLMPEWNFYFTRGRARLSEGRLRPALEDLRRAVGMLNSWRAEVPAEDHARIGVDAQLQEVYSALADAGNLLYLETGDPALPLETFSAEEQNRAASLREFLGIEAEAANADPGDAALFSFLLGEQASWGWVRSGGRVAVYRLPPQAEIARAAAQFTGAVTANSGVEQAAGRLYRMLFGPAPARCRSQRRWLLAVDGPLYAVPFSALRENGAWLIERHTLQVVSGALLFGAARPQFDRGFLAVGDPVYNPADERWPGPRYGLQAAVLPRLAGSGREIRSCARVWGAAQLLEGMGATKDGLRTALERQPSVVHLATHVLDDGNIALSRGETVSPHEIARWHVNADLVVLSGCSSGRARAVPGAGLMGMTRAWLAAGAHAVAASLWPTPDDSGELFQAFYQELRLNPEAGTAAALRRAQLAVLRQGGWRAEPRYWSAYFEVANQ